MELPINNPASRILELLNNARTRNMDADFKKVIAALFDINLVVIDDPKANLEIAQAMGQIHKTLDDIESSIRAIEGINHDLYLRSMSAFRDAFSLNYWHITNYLDILRRLPEGDMTVMTFCADLLSKMRPEKVIANEDLTSLLTELQELYGNVQNSNIDDKLKTVILDLPESTRRAVHEYRVRGAIRLEETLSQIIGTLTYHQDLFREDKDKEPVRDFGKFFSHLSSSVSFAANTIKLIEAGAAYLPGLLR
jgi:hypothetical protein